ncbi:hypothetical protein WAI453_008420 [Rhynchosporium graminicola]|uniref:DUF4185 domain-containing protein n=1 Tax=Rhynchosporium graminicola TaxID=2792576 RepID=A0A1E1KLX1_9HELO|nr:uncharacterized protein RCO7_00406 [Rhynchosporium commune]
MSLVMQAVYMFTLAQLVVAGPLAFCVIPAPVIKSSTPIQNMTSNFPWAIRRDGGGGGTISGKHIVNFADTTTSNPDALRKLGFLPFASNSIAIAGEDGMHVTDTGVGKNVGVKQMWPFATSKSPINGETREENKPNHRYAIWPNTNIVSACGGACGYTVSNVLDITILPYAENFLYSTLAKITIGNEGPTVKREAVALWYKYEMNYGDFGLARARDGSNDIFLFAAPEKSFGMKVARVCETEIADKTKYLFWNGKTWSKNPPGALDSTANIFQYNEGGFGPGTGDIFWNKHLNTWISVFNDEMSAYSMFRLMYSTTGNILGPWSEKPIDAYKPFSCGDNKSNLLCSVPYNYGTHAYPDIDTTGKTLLLSWTYDGQQTMFSTIEFE